MQTHKFYEAGVPICGYLMIVIFQLIIMLRLQHYSKNFQLTIV